MLSGIKEKLLNVKKNVNLFTSEVKSPPTEDPQFYAGAEILDHFEQEWVHIRDMNERNADTADKIAKGIDDISKKMQRDKESIQLITHILSHSNLSSNISLCLNQIKTLSETTRKIEDNLIKLDIVLDESYFICDQAMHKRHLQRYKMKQTEDLYKLRDELVEKQRKKLLTEEAEAKKELVIRQKVFQEAFESDLERYKASGEIPVVTRKSQSPNKESGAILEEIKFDYDKNELEKFLNE